MSDSATPMQCPSCGEPVKSTWKICPACETRLQAQTCAACGAHVKENWKRCPECEAQLVCPTCQRRFAGGQTQCPQCLQPAPGATLDSPAAEVITDAVCGIELVRVTGGPFQMGDTFGDGIENEGPVHRVNLHEFYIARYPVTQAQWLRLRPENPSRFQGPDHPVEQVAWDDAVAFARGLTEAHKGRFIFRLPSEAEWEYAARSGGREERYAGGNAVEQVAWISDNSQGRTQPVGRKAPNGLGLFDMSGNVWEWCRDLFAVDAYHRHSPANPVIENESSSEIPDRVIRGGSWNLDAWSARCARRFSFKADFFGPGLGFRLVMTLSDH
jgi:formylglycine-generating enzyme required for sulfatase activity